MILISSSSLLPPVLVCSPRKDQERTDEMEVHVLLKELVTEVEKSERPKDGRRGADKRKSYSYSFRMDVLNEIENGMAPVDAAFKFRVSEASVSKWQKDKKNILAKAADQHMRNFRKGRPSTKHDALFQKLLGRFRTTRAKGRMVSFK